MDWLIGILFLTVLVIWMIRERRHSRTIREVLSAIDDLAHGDSPTSEGTRKGVGEISRNIEKISKETMKLGRQRKLAEANLQIILSSMEEGVLVVDSKRSVRLMNPSARRLFGVDEHAVGSQTLQVTKAPELEEMIQKALGSGESQEGEIEVGGRQSATLTVRVAPMRDASGEAGTLVMFRDVTRLTQLEKVRREFVANVSHELRTPLAIFQGYVENLQDFPDMPIEERLEAYAVLDKHSKRLNALVEDLLELARLEARSEELEFTAVDVADFCDELRRDWAIRFEKREVSLKLSVPENLPKIRADRRRLEQVFTNLLDNALKYTPPGNHITLGAGVLDEEVEVWVADTGQGILSSKLPHIFERFYRADNARSRELGGTGLGLSIVKHIAQAHGGSVAAESIYGKGTTIRVRIPIDRGSD